MRKKLFVLAILILLAALIPAAVVLAKAPLRGEFTMEFYADIYRDKFVFWVGEITGEDIEGEILWWGDPLGIREPGQTVHYEVGWEIWDQDVLLMAGEVKGINTERHQRNANWRQNGIVTYVHDDYEEWLGRPVHISGHYNFAAPGLPSEGDGIFRVN